MIDNKKYAPFLKGKLGEFTALDKLPDELKNNIVPVIEIVPNPFKSIEEHLNSVIGYFSKWGKEKPIYIDGYMIDNEEFLPDSTHPIYFLFQNLVKNNYYVIPVISNVISIEHKSIIRDISNNLGRGLGLRIFKNSVEEINNIIEEHLSFVDFPTSQIDLIIDLRSLIESDVEERIEFCTQLFGELRFLNSWRSIVLTGGNFPIDLTELTADQIHILPRKSFTIWERLVKSDNLERLPAFGDYAISHPSLSEFEGEYPNASASIRYTHENNFLVYRGKGVRQRGYEQFYDISETLINSPHFYEIEHCPGCEFIYTCGTDKDGTGNLTTWRWVGTAHHITVVVNQLRQFFRDLSA